MNLKLPDEGIDLEKIEMEILVQAYERHDWNQTLGRVSKHLPEDSDLLNGEIRIGRVVREFLFDLVLRVDSRSGMVFFKH